MDSTAQKLDWHYETLPNETKKALDFLSTQSWFSQTGWYLAGGTALALQAGHRKSFDLDFFTEKKDFDEKEVLAYFKDNEDWVTEVERKNTIYGELFKAKISFIAYPFFMPKQQMSWHGKIKVMHPMDIGVMKITAVSQRGRKRDFFDLYWCAHNIEPMEKIIGRLQAQYPSVAHDYHHILKSLVYFEDAESDPEPEIYFKADWGTVKNFFITEIPIIASKVMNLNQ